jgi:hypothetical protein
MRSLTSLTIEEMGCFLTWAPKSSNIGAMINGEKNQWFGVAMGSHTLGKPQMV